MLIRPETPADVAAIDVLTARAFAGAPYSDGSESLIIRRLREAGRLAVSLIAERGEIVVGHVAVSPVSISDRSTGWYGLGPISVEPSIQRSGVGSMLMRAALHRLRELNASGCVVLGNPAYYSRFGFAMQPGLVYPGPPAEHFMATSFSARYPSGQVTYHSAFSGEA
jgi:putative acetyltransferase